MLHLGNVAGFWALLGIPAILLIHFLQRKSKVLPITTLFLLDQLNRESVSGRRFDQLRSSIPLWLQLLAVLILTWLLVQPRWLEKSSVQRVVVVLDSSASMIASKDALAKDLPAALEKIAAKVATTEIILLDSLLEKESLYHGTDLKEFSAVLSAWTPETGSHDPTAALRIARSLADKDGLVVFATDHPSTAAEMPEAAGSNVEISPALPFAARRFSAGTAKNNAGFAGLTLEEKDGQMLWRASLRNYASVPVTRQWWTEINGQKSNPQTITLDPGQTRVIQGLFPPAAQAIHLKCDADAFPLDDSMPLVLAQPKKIAVNLPAADVTPGEERLYHRIFSSLPDTVLTDDPAAANVEVVHYDALNPATPLKPTILFVQDSREKLPAIPGDILVESHPFTDGLNWQGLIALDALGIPLKSSDTPLVWQGTKALVFLRGEGLARQLCFNFDLKKSNARNLPAFIICIHRYLESVREQLPLHAAENFECGQKLRLAANKGENAAPLILTWNDGTGEKELTIPAAQAGLLQAPIHPAFFTVTQDKLELLRGASQFADTREADLSRCGPANEVASAQRVVVDKFTREDSHWRLYLLILLAALLVSWWFVRKNREIPSTKGAAAVPGA